MAGGDPHSPLVLASLEPLFDATTDALFELQLGTDEYRASDFKLRASDAEAPKVVLQNPTFRPRGGGEQWLVSGAFGLSSSRSVPAERLIEEAANLLKQDPSPDAVLDMEQRLADVLPDLDPFWVRWRALRPGARAQA